MGGSCLNKILFKDFQSFVSEKKIFDFTPKEYSEYISFCIEIEETIRDGEYIGIEQILKMQRIGDC